MRSMVFTFLLAACGSAWANTQSPYVGEESYAIKSLSPSEIEGLLQGDGLGFAKAAELNQYPGPRHVLDLADELKLSDKQVKETNQLFESMRAQAMSLGTQLVDYERELDELFSTGKVDTAGLDAVLLKIGETKAKLRGAHLQAHLVMKDILNRHQVVMYDNLRGYSSGGHQHGHSH